MAFTYPESRYYYDWYQGGVPIDPAPPSDGAIKATVVDRLRENLFTKDCDLAVDVKRGVVILRGVVDSRLAKRSAGDDCWDTAGVTDVSNQLEVADVAPDEGPERVRDVMITDVVALNADASLQSAGTVMRDNDVGSVVVTHNAGIAGIVTDRDIVVRAVADGRDVTATSLGAVCSDKVVTVGPDEPVEVAVQLMRQHAIRRIVVSEEDRPVGVVSMGDLARRRDPGSVLADVVSAPPQS